MEGPKSVNLFGFNIDFTQFFKSKSHRRKWERVRTIEVLYLDYKSTGPPLQGTGEAQDISLGGIRFKSDDKIPKGTLLELKLRFAAGSTTTDSLIAHGHVVGCSKSWRQKHFHVRCQLERLNQVQQKQLELFIKWWKERSDKYIQFRYGDTV